MCVYVCVRVSEYRRRVSHCRLVANELPWAARLEDFAPARSTGQGSRGGAAPLLSIWGSEVNSPGAGHARSTANMNTDRPKDC